MREKRISREVLYLPYKGLSWWWREMERCHEEGTHTIKWHEDRWCVTHIVTTKVHKNLSFNFLSFISHLNFFNGCTGQDLWASLGVSRLWIHIIIIIITIATMYNDLISLKAPSRLYFFTSSPSWKVSSQSLCACNTKFWQIISPFPSTCPQKSPVIEPKINLKGYASQKSHFDEMS